MKTKEILTLVVAVVTIVICSYFGYTMLFPSQTNKQTENVEAQKVNIVPSEIDETTYKAVESLSDYGKPALEGLGKTDLFN